MGRIERILGRLEGLRLERPQPLLRKRNRVRTVHATTAIEGNRLTHDEVIAVLDGRRVAARASDLTEVLNANAAYERLTSFRATSATSLLRAHGVLMKGLVHDAGRFRAGSVGVLRGTRVLHLAPPAHLVDSHVRALLAWVRSTRAPLLVAGCALHYELLFIHPFSDGNGRLARLWQQVVHLGVSPVLAYVPVESVIRERQRTYYTVLRRCDSKGDCSEFILFCLNALGEALDHFARQARPEREDAAARLDSFLRARGPAPFTRAEYLAFHPRLSTASASRDLANGVSMRRLARQGTRATARYRLRSAAAWRSGSGSSTQAVNRSSRRLPRRPAASSPSTRRRTRPRPSP
jgi:Fic family protein